MRKYILLISLLIFTILHIIVCYVPKIAMNLTEIKAESSYITCVPINHIFKDKGNEIARFIQCLFGMLNKWCRVTLKIKKICT